MCNDSHQNDITLCECHSGPTYGETSVHTCVFACLVIRISSGLSWSPALAFTCNDPHQNDITLCECHSGPTYVCSHLCVFACLVIRISSGGAQHWPSCAMTLTRMPLHCVNVTVVRYMVRHLFTLVCFLA